MPRSIVAEPQPIPNVSTRTTWPQHVPAETPLVAVATARMVVLPLLPLALSRLPSDGRGAQADVVHARL